MTQKEVVKLFAAIAMLYPRDNTFIKQPDEVRDMWHGMLADIPFELAEAALKMHAASSPFPPSIAEIRKNAVDAKCPMLDGDEAYRLAREARRKFGHYQAKEAMDSLPEAVTEVIRTFAGTFEIWCESVADGTERAQFLRIWEAMKARKQQKAALPPGVADVMKRLAGDMCALPE